MIKTGNMKIKCTMKNKIYILILSILYLTYLCVNIYASDISINLTIDKNEITVGEEATLTVIITGKVRSLPDPNIPQLKEFMVYSAGRSESISIINGDISSSTSFNYIIVPKKEGQFTIGPISLNYRDKEYKSRELKITVHSQTSGADTYNKNIPDDNIHKQNQDKNEESLQDLFIETHVDKKSPYVNEQITLTFAFYQAINLSDTPEYIPASITGFWTEDLPPQRRYYKPIKGKRYLVTELYSALFPTASGEYTIGAAELVCNPEDVYDPFSFFSGRPRKSVKLKTKPIKIKVNPLPDKDVPPCFQGAVGNYTLEASVDKTSTRENEPVTLKIVIRGHGNIKTVPDLELPPEIDENFKKYKSNSSVNVTKNNYNVQGEKTFEFILVPIKSGDISIPQIKFSYFSPNIKK
ncbi:MAG: protein BatD [Candidatus Firestonebacteria bacterium]|nr:protein BatD [Candidatus Firestonebacteria bacterium]